MDFYKVYGAWRPSMIAFACILFGCLHGNSVRYHLERALPKTEDEVKAACYVEGVFYLECPTDIKYKP